jgi:hypothetical protein
LFAGISIILVVTTLDEYFYIRGKQDLPAWIRLLAQIVAAVVAIYIGGIAIDEWVFQGVVLSVPFVLFA